MSGEWFIYGLRAPGSEVLRYVGYSACPEKRFIKHLSYGRNRARPYPLYDWIGSILDRGEKPEMVILEKGVGVGADDAEKYWISVHKQSLFNIGEGGLIPHIPAESRASAREKLRKRVFTDEHRARISKANRGRSRPDYSERLRTLSQKNIGKKMILSDVERERRREHMKRIRVDRKADIL